MLLNERGAWREEPGAQGVVRDGTQGERRRRAGANELEEEDKGTLPLDESRFSNCSSDRVKSQGINYSGQGPVGSELGR